VRCTIFSETMLLHFFNVFGLVAVHVMLLFLYRTRLAETR
jgi:hypothetical protein